MSDQGSDALVWLTWLQWNELFKRWLKSLKHKKNPSQSLTTIKLTAIEEMLSATVAGILTTVIVNPIWVRKPWRCDGDWWDESAQHVQVINTRLKIAAKKAFGKKENSNGKVKTRRCFGSDPYCPAKHLESNGTSNGSSHHLANGSSNGTNEMAGEPRRIGGRGWSVVTLCCNKGRKSPRGPRLLH